MLRVWEAQAPEVEGTSGSGVGHPPVQAELRRGPAALPAGAASEMDPPVLAEWRELPGRTPPVMTSAAATPAAATTPTAVRPATRRRPCESRAGRPRKR